MAYKQKPHSPTTSKFISQRTSQPGRHSVSSEPSSRCAPTEGSAAAVGSWSFFTVKDLNRRTRLIENERYYFQWPASSQEWLSIGPI